jgi:hypothetical protein
MGLARLKAPVCCLIAALLPISCVTTGGPSGPKTQAAQAAEADTREAEERMEKYLAAGTEKIGQGNVSEGIQQLVAVLSERQKLAAPSKAAEETSRKAEMELSTVGSALNLDSGTEWVDENKNQVTGNAIDLGTPKALQPSVILSFNMGRGRTLVAGAPIVFEFVKGSGVLTGFATTNEYGQANCAIAKLDSQDQEQIIRASLAYRMGSFTYRFQGLTRDFVYVPPSRRATILALERSSSGANQPPLILNSVYNTLKGITFDLSNFDGTLLGESFMKVFAGDPQAIGALGVKKDVSYLVMVLNDCYAATQVVLEGKKYNIFKSQTTATMRIIRVADGKILYSAAVQGVSGQGGTENKAIMDGFRNASDGLAGRIRSDLGAIDKALAAKMN